MWKTKIGEDEVTWYRVPDEDQRRFNRPVRLTYKMRDKNGLVGYVVKERTDHPYPWTAFCPEFIGTFTGNHHAQRAVESHYSETKQSSSVT